MVKGVARRVVVLTSPDPKQFEQAIFLLREDALDDKPPEEQVLRQAQAVADAYLQRSSPRHRRWRRLWVPALWTLAGAAMASAVWVLGAGGLPLFF